MQNSQDAARLEDRLKHRGQHTIFFSKAGGLLIPVCVIKQHLGLCDVWQWSGSRGSAALGGGLEFCLASDGQAHRPPTDNGGKAAGGLEHTEVIFTLEHIFRLVENEWKTG